MREAAVDAADAAGGEDADPDRARDGERASDRRGADGVLHDRGGEIAGTDLARVRAEPGELLRSQPDAHLAVENSDGRRERAGRADLPLGLEPDLGALARREAVRDERRLERHDGAAGSKGVAHLVRDADHAGRSISTKRLSSLLRTSRNPALR